MPPPNEKRKGSELASSSKKAHTKDLYENFRQGDIVYGLLTPRNIVNDELHKRGYTNTYTNALNDPAVRLAMNSTLPAKATEELSQAQYKHFLFLSKHREYLNREPGRTIPNMLEDRRLGAGCRRACKLLLINRDPERTYHAHVITTDIDWKRVCDKKKSGLGVTDSEMRSAYRDARLHGKNPHILFYDKHLRLLETPPWEQPKIAEEFARYDLQRTAKPKVGK